MQDWKRNPLSEVNRMFEEGNSLNEVLLHFKEKLSDEKEVYSIPSLNDSNLDLLKPSSLVRVRGMIQDMYDPEYYLGVYETLNKRNNITSKRCGWFRDVIYETDHEINADSSVNITQERMTYYCIPIVAESSWCREGYASKYICSEAVENMSTEQHAKHGREECLCENPNSNKVESNGADTSGREIVRETGDQLMYEAHQAMHKKLKVENMDASSGAAGAGGSRTDNFLPNVDRKACIVKVYDGMEKSFVLNDCAEFIGILTVDPVLAFSEEEMEMDDEQGMVKSSAFKMGTDACQPPPSLVPRIHVIAVHKLSHNNPLLPIDMDTCKSKEEIDQICLTAHSIREELHAIFERALFGDTLAADYVICYLLSSIYSRKDVYCLGKFCLNLSNVQDGNFIQNFYQLLELIVTKICFLPFSLANLNKKDFAPRKDYVANKLIPGFLQLSGNTHLVVDETQLCNGQLDALGVRNVTHIGNLISWQKVAYDFAFHTMEYDANVAVLVLSDGKSALPSDCHVPLRPNSAPLPDSSDHFQAIATYLTPTLLDQIRRYATAMKLLPYELSEELQQVVQNDFLESRQIGASMMTADDFHKHLVLARLLSISEGQRSLTREMWDKARRMELERKMRVSS